jgi:ribosomal protein S18 acetylase RimI-like enzyme
MVSAILPQETVNTGDGMRPVNLRTDLAQLADLIELVFADTMDSGGRAALREMRMLSKFGVGLNMLSRMNEMALGINLGYVWIENGKLVGNVSVYPARLPAGFGSGWIIANVGVHPDYQRRGIAKRLMLASMEMIHERGGDFAILQVDYDNPAAIRLYQQLGFIEERAWSLWRRTGSARLPVPVETEGVVIGWRRNSEWQAEYALARRVRPEEKGGLGWLRPLYPGLFRTGFFSWLNDLFNMRQFERLVIREGDIIRASLWVDNGFGSSTRLTLMTDPDPSGIYNEALIGTAVRRFGGDTLTIEHPFDDHVGNHILERYRFYRQRSIIHMRWDT